MTSTEKRAAPLQKMALELMEQTKKVTKDLEIEYEQFLLEKKKFEDEQKALSDKYQIKESVIELNIGGKHFTTLKSTLLRAEGTMLGAMFSGRYDPGSKDIEGRYFLDRPPEPFAKILNCLRTNSKLDIPEDDLEREILLREVEFYGMNEYFAEELKEPTFRNSTLLSNKHMTQLSKMIESKSSKDWVRCYCGSKDGFSSSNFHQKVNNQGENVVVIKSSNGYIFGAYVPQSWSSAGRYVFNTKTFLFSLENALKKPIKLPNNGPHLSNQYSFYDYSSYGPCFGGGHDLYIAGNGCNTGNSNYSNLGHSFTCPEGQTYGQNGAKNFLAGSYNFTVSEIEVFKRAKK
eukprot:gene9231-1317_t